MRKFLLFILCLALAQNAQVTGQSKAPAKIPISRDDGPTPKPVDPPVPPPKPVDPPKILPPSVPPIVHGKVNRPARVVVSVPQGKKLRYALAFVENDDLVWDELIAKENFTRKFSLDAAVPGTYYVNFWYSGEDLPALTTFIIDGPAPTPVDPTPVEPTPKPPTPAADLPISGDGFRVLVTIDTVNTLPAKQQLAIFATDIRMYLNSKCAKGDDGKTPEYRIYPKTTDVTAESKLWQDAFARTKKSIPWVQITNGKIGFEGELPADHDSFLALLKKYGGN